MKELLALVAIVLCVGVAYRMHRERLDAGQKPAAGVAETVTMKSLSECLEPYRKDLFTKLDEQRATDLVPPLEELRATVVARSQQSDAASQTIGGAGVAALDQMIAAARLRTDALQQLLKLTSAPTGALEREDSQNTARSFFRESAIRRAEEVQSQRRAAVEQALAQLRRAEAKVAAEHGVKATQADFGSRRTSAPRLKTDTAAAGNPLDREAYDQRKVVIPRSRSSDSGSF